MTPEILATARAWTDLGVGAFPVHVDTEKHTKTPVGKWKAQAALSLASVGLERLPWERGNALGLAMGNGWEMLEFEASFLDQEKFSLQKFSDFEGGLYLLGGYWETSMRGGVHLIYRVRGMDVPGNTKVAKSATGETWVETRGTGGFVVVAPSPGYGTIRLPSDAVTLGQVNRDTLLEALRATYNEEPPRPGRGTPTRGSKRLKSVKTGGLRPGDRYDADPDNSWESILGPHSWQLSHEGEEGRVYWTRPGKQVNEGHSAVTGGTTDHMYVWSGEGQLPEEEPLSKFAVYTHLNHDGDFHEAAQSLIKTTKQETSNTVRKGLRERNRQW